MRRSSNYAVSQPIEFFIGFVIIVAGIFFALFAVSQFFVPQEPEIEQKDFLLKAFILSDHLINDPGNWSITDDNVNVSDFGLAYAGETPMGNSYGVLDSAKLVLLNDKEPNDKYINYTEAKKILGLKDYEFRMQVVKNGVKAVDFGRTFSNTLTTATVTRNVYVYNESRGISEPATLVVTVSKQGEGFIFNNDPVAIDKTVFTDENTPVSFTLNASDDVFDLLTFSIEGSPSNGTLFYDGNPVSSFPYTISTKFLAGNISDRPSITYVPEFNGYGTFTFLFNVSDDYGGWDIGTITLNVGYVPYPIASDYSVALFGGDSIYVDVVSGSSYHPDELLGSVNLFINSSSIISSPSNGNVTVVNSTTVLYTADEDFSGSDVFEYRLYDDTWEDTLGVLSDVGRVNVNICPVDGWYCNGSDTCQIEWRDYSVSSEGGCTFTVNDSTVQTCCNKHNPSGWVFTSVFRWMPSSNGCCDIKQVKQEYWENDSYCDSSTQSCVVTHTVTDTRWVNVTPTIYQDNDSACSYKNGWYSNGTRSVPYGECCDKIEELMEWRDYKCSSCGCSDEYVVNESTEYYRDTGQINYVDSKCPANKDVWKDTGNTQWIDDPATECGEKEQKQQRKYIRDYYCADDCNSCPYTDTPTSDYRWVDTGNKRPDDSRCSANTWIKTGSECVGRKSCEIWTLYGYSCSGVSYTCTATIISTEHRNCKCSASCGGCTSDSSCPADSTTTTTQCVGKKTCDVTTTTDNYCDPSTCTCKSTTSTSTDNCRCDVGGPCGATCGILDAGGVGDPTCGYDSEDCTPFNPGELGYACGGVTFHSHCVTRRIGCVERDYCIFKCYYKKCASCECTNVPDPSAPTVKCWYIDEGVIEPDHCHDDWGCDIQDRGCGLFAYPCSSSCPPVQDGCCLRERTCREARDYYCKCDTTGECAYIPTSCGCVETGYISLGTCSCFPAGTKIAMIDGSYKNIEDIKVGDIVKTYNVIKHENEKGIVTKLYKHSSDEMYGDYYLIINNQLKVTINHPLYVNGEWKNAGEIQIGDKLQNNKGKTIIVTSIKKIYKKVPTYNLEVENNHNYYADGILVHNKTSCPSCSTWTSAGTCCSSSQKKQKRTCYNNLHCSSSSCTCICDSYTDYRCVSCSSGYHCEGGSCVKDDSNCFLAGTKIAMIDGSYKNIEDIKVGDLVKSYAIPNTNDTFWEEGVVTKVFHHPPEEMGDYYLIINNELRVTPNHPIYLNGTLITAGDLKIGDGGLDGKVYSIQKVYDRVPTYNFEVEPYHNYEIVWSNNSKAVVHNAQDKTCCLPAGTKISLPFGLTKSIENIRKGDIVLSYDLSNDTYVFDVVIRTVIKNRTVYNINNGLIRPTNDHPLYIRKANGDRVWAAINPELAKKAYPDLDNISVLQIGDELFTGKGWIKIYSIDHEPEIIKTYTFSLKNHHQYFANGILVRNGAALPDTPIIIDPGDIC